MSKDSNEVSSTVRARASQKVVGVTAYAMQTHPFEKEEVDSINQMSEKALRRRIIQAIKTPTTQMIQTDAGIVVPEFVLERWEKWPELWKQIDPKIVIDLNDHKIGQWKEGYDWPIVMPKRDQVNPLRSWEYKLALFAKETTAKYEGIKPSAIRDMSPYRSVFCAKPNFECKVEYPNTSSEAIRDMGINGTTFTEYNVLEMFVYTMFEKKHIDTSSVCLCTDSLSERGVAVVADWIDKPEVDHWLHCHSDGHGSVRQTV